MKFYNGLIKFDGSGKIKDIIMVDDGFSFSCLLFAPLWFLFHKMWQEFFGLIIAILLINLVLSRLTENDNLLFLAFIILVANNCKSWYCEYLISRKKYYLVAVVLAKNKLEAQNKLTNQIAKFGQNHNKLFFSEEIFEAIDLVKNY
jgi:hypothetical protein